MKQFIKIFLMLIVSTLLNASNNWAPIMMGDIITFVPYTETIEPPVPDTTPQVTTNVAQYEPNETVSITINGELSGDQDWAGIFRVGDNNDWANVIAWNWVTNGTTQLDIIRKEMPAGEYEVRLFFHNEYGVNAIVRARYVFNVEGREFGTEGLYLNQVRSVKTSEDGLVNNAIYYVEGVDNLPTVIFMSGWKSNLDSYDGFLTYVASLGYCVIAKQERGECFTPSVYNQELTDRLNMVHNTYNADITKLGIIGHSSGGGVVHYLMQHFKSNNIAGTEKSVVMSLDGWFPFGTTEAMLNAFDTPTLLMQFGGLDGINTDGIHPDWDDYAGQLYHHYQDPKINLAIFKSLTKASVDKEYIVLEANNDHSYFAGNYASLITKRDFLAPVDEFLNHTIGSGDAMNLINNYDNVIINDLSSEYRFYCHTAGFDFCDLDMLIFP